MTGLSGVGAAGTFGDDQRDDGHDWFIRQRINASTRLMNITGVDNAAAMLLLFGDGDDVINGLLATNEGTEPTVSLPTSSVWKLRCNDRLQPRSNNLRCNRNVGWWMDDQRLFSTNDSLVEQVP